MRQMATNSLTDQVVRQRKLELGFRAAIKVRVAEAAAQPVHRSPGCCLLPRTAGPAEQRFHRGELLPEYLVIYYRKLSDRNGTATAAWAPSDQGPNMRIIPRPSDPLEQKVSGAMKFSGVQHANSTIYESAPVEEMMAGATPASPLDRPPPVSGTRIDARLVLATAI